MLTLEEIKELHDKAYNHDTVTRDKASDDLVFYWVTQWDDNLLSESQLQYRGEFNILRKAGRDIIGNLRANTFQVDFEPKDDSRIDEADIADGLYRSSERDNTSIEAYNNAMQETIVCGIGAWELYTKYETNAVGDERQIICRRPLYEANNNVFWDPNSQLLDGSDADYVSILAAYSEDGYRKEVSRLTGQPPEDVDVTNFKTPNESYTFPWVWEDSVYYIARFYYKETVTEKNYVLQDPFGQQMIVRDIEFDKIEEEALDAGYEIIEERPIDRDVVTLYYVSGNDIISTYRIAGGCIPVIPYMGETQFVEGQRSREGITRLAKDPQRLYNFINSYVADIASRSPRPKPIFTQEQIGGFEHMYEETGIDNAFPYLLQNSTDTEGNPLPMGPIAQMPEASVPTAVQQLIDLSRQGVADVANPGVPQDIADPDLSGKAVKALQAKIDEQWYIYRDNYKHAKRRDGVVWASMASEVFDSPRQLTVTLPDGTRKKVEMMQSVVDRETGEVVTINDLSALEFDVYADIGHSYANQREETLDRLAEMSQEIAATDPAMHKLLMLKRFELIEGVQMDSLRNYARKQLILMGIEEPETEEEIMMVAQAQQAQQQPDAAQQLAMAEAQARLMEGQADMIDKQVDQFNAETKRLEAVVKAQKAGADITKINAETAKLAQDIRTDQLDNRIKLVQPLRMGA